MVEVWCVILGAGLGLVFFGGLWWTVRQGLDSQRPAFWFLGSVLLRTGFVMGGFYWLSQTHLTHLLMGLLGFFMARLMLTQLANKTEKVMLVEAHHAPKP